MVIGLTQECSYEEAKGRSSTQRCREARWHFSNLVQDLKIFQRYKDQLIRTHYLAHLLSWLCLVYMLLTQGDNMAKDQ
jgi:hypothetical protein